MFCTIILIAVFREINLNIMTEPQEKAYDIVRKIGSATLFTRFNGGNTIEKEEAKLYALVAVDEMLKLFYRLTDEYKYWEEVKQEIEKL